MTKISVDFNREIGTIKPIHGVGQPPISGMDFSMFSYLKEANIPYSRLHDVGGAYGSFRYVDIPNIFRDFSADPYLPESYDFAFTDLIITALMENGVEPFFRLGVTIENFAAIKAYRIYPPSDFKKWAIVCEHIIRHYTQGWANGFNYDIKYWEIWNEPDNYETIEENQMWKGTKEEFYELYTVASKHLKSKFPHLKIGGYGSCGFYALSNTYESAAKSSPRYEYFITFFEEFLDYIKKNDAPLDFFSWHTYDRNVQHNQNYAEYARKKLNEAGYTEAETTCNEWNIMAGERGTMLHAARNTAMLIGMQNSALDSSMFYDAQISLSVYGGLFDPIKRKPYPLYQGFKIFGNLYTLKNQVNATSDNENFYVLAATDGEKGGILLVNIGDDTDLEIELNGKTVTACCTVTENAELQDCEVPKFFAKHAIFYIETN